jgi:hypothetical protein
MHTHTHAPHAGVNPAPKFDQPPANYTVRFFMAVPNAFIISVFTLVAYKHSSHI